MVSVYSIFSAVFFYNIALIAIYILMRKTKFVINYTASFLGLLTLLATIRLLFPADLTSAFIIKSIRVFPAIQSLISSTIPKTTVTVGGMLKAVWVLGILAYLCYDLYLVLAAKTVERRFVYINNEQIQRLATELNIRCPVMVSPNISEPYSAGMLKPTIYLPNWDLTDQEIRTVLCHEYQHVRSCDALKKLVFLLLEALFWWNPISHIFRREFNQLLEIQCDQKLTANKCAQEKLQYAEILLCVMKRVTEIRRNCFCSCSFSCSMKNMEQRFELILETKSAKSRSIRTLLYMALILVFALSYFVIAQPHYEPPLSTIEGICVVNEETSFILFDSGVYTLYCEGERIANISEDDLSNQSMKTIPVYEKNKR